MRYFLDRDNDAHWYLVEADKRAEWNAWLALSDEDENSWRVPSFAKPLGGNPSSVTFDNPEVNG
jgi:hypothetical protein